MALSIVIVLGIVLGIVYCFLFGLFAYLFIIKIIPEKYKNKFFLIVPFFPKMPYSFLLYVVSGVFYSIAIYLSGITEPLIQLFFIVLSIIASSLLIKQIAKFRKDNMEETYEEEMERKRNSV